MNDEAGHFQRFPPIPSSHKDNLTILPCSANNDKQSLAYANNDKQSLAHYFTNYYHSCKFVLASTFHVARIRPVESKRIP